MNAVALLPARYGATRLPGKPLASLGDAPLIIHTWRRAAAFFGRDHVWIATDDDRVAAAAEAHHAAWVMTRRDHLSGTERIAEAVAKLDLRAPFIFNIQGDEPFLETDELHALLQVMQAGASIGTLVEPFAPGSPQIDDPNRVKAVLGQGHQALYFSRAALPFCRSSRPEHPVTYYRHIGLYAFQRDTLMQLVRLALHPLEQAEQLEQLRWLANGHQVQTAIVPARSRLSIDTPFDLEEARRWLHAKKTSSFSDSKPS